MQKSVYLPVLAVAGGISGAILRRWQLIDAYDAETRLFSLGAPSSLLLLGLMAALTVVFAILCQGGRRPEDFLDAYRCPVSGYMTLMTISAFLFFVAGALGLIDGIRELALWRAIPEARVVTYPTVLLLCGGLCFPSGAAALLLGRDAYRGVLADSSSLLAVFPPFAGLALVFATHLAHGTDPVLLNYGFTLAAAALLMLAHYYTAGYFHDCRHPHRAIFCGLMGVSVGLTTLIGESDLFFCAAVAAFSLSALANTYALLRGVFGPPWPKRSLNERMPPAGEEQTDE